MDNSWIHIPQMSVFCVHVDCQHADTTYFCVLFSFLFCLTLPEILHLVCFWGYLTFLLNVHIFKCFQQYMAHLLSHGQLDDGSGR